MTSAATPVPGLTAEQVVAAVREARRVELDAAARQLELALAWAHLHPCPAGEHPAGWGEVDLHGEGLVPLAGPGAPQVAEFAPADLGAALGISLEAARSLVADALELAHRFPRLWALVQAGRVPAWKARGIVTHIHDLSVQAAAFADRLIAATPDRVGQVRAERLVEEARLYFDPDRAVADEEAALAKRGVWLRHGAAPATTEVSMTLDTPDADHLDATLTRLAHDLKTLGDTDVLDVRRARAVGVLADPQYALDLMSGSEGAAPGRREGTTNLYLHLTPADLAAHLTDDQPSDRSGDGTGPGGAGGTGGAGAATIERLGAATTRLLADWLTRCTATGSRVIVRPVLDPTTIAAVDAHDPPETMREAALLRDAHCVFPGCGRDSRTCDLDHITPYVPPDEGGPPGQTHLENLAPLCRSHHRVKTHTAWTYRRTPDGHFEWTSPTGHHYQVTTSPRSLTRLLARPTPPRRRA